MDAYELCPCGSGKKVKFCCHKIIPEMEKIERLQENQPEQALVHLDRLEQSSPGNPWVATMRAGTLMQQGEFNEAKISLLKFLKEHPDHPRANSLYAFASFHADGYPACKKAVHRAFKRSVTESPRIVSALLEALGEHHYMQANLPAARAHLMLSLRIAPTEEDRQRVIGGIMRFDADPSIPFLLRGGQHIPQYEPSDAVRETFDKARHLSLLACWEEAGDLIEELTEQDGESPELWHMLGLFRAWDGDEESAAEALHKAVGLYGDTPTAIECETLAQFLDRSHSDSVVPMRMQRYEVSSVSQLLSKLDDDPRFVRSDEQAGFSDGPGEPTAVYLVLDRSLPPKEELAELTAETVPVYDGRLLVFDAGVEDDMPPMAFLTGLEGQQLTTAEAAFAAAAEGLVKHVEGEPGESTDAEAAPPSEADAELEVIGEIHLDELPLHRNYFVPPGTPGPVRTEILEAHWKRIVEELWPSTPQEVLQGKSPMDAAKDASLKVPLQASLLLFEAFGDERGRIIPVDKLREQLGLEPLPNSQLDDENPAVGLSNFDLERMDLTALSDAHLEELIERVRLAAHRRLVYAALREWIGRDREEAEADDDSELTTGKACTLLTSIAAELGRLDEALEWVARGRETAAKEGDDAFRDGLVWKMQELRIRAVSGSPDELRPLLLDLWENYGAKLPNLREQLRQLVDGLEIDPPWESAIVTAGTDWSPGQPQSGGESEKKLWIPGQD